MRYFFIVITTFQSLILFSQRGINPDFGTRSLSLNGISTTLDKQDAIFNNFANIVNSDKLELIASTQRRFSLSELTIASFGVSTPIQNIGQFGLSFSNYGFELYSEQKLSLMYARKLHDILAISVNFDYNSIRIDEYGNNSAFSFGLGLSGRITEELTYGIYIFNPEKIEIANNTEISSVLRFGLKYEVSEKLDLYIETEKIVDEEINFIFGIEYLIMDRVFLRVSSNTNPGALSFGIGYDLGNQLSFDGGATYDTLLGFTPGLSLKYRR